MRGHRPYRIQFPVDVINYRSKLGFATNVTRLKGWTRWLKNFNLIWSHSKMTNISILINVCRVRYELLHTQRVLILANIFERFQDYNRKLILFASWVFDSLFIIFNLQTHMPMQTLALIHSLQGFQTWESIVHVCKSFVTIFLVTHAIMKLKKTTTVTSYLSFDSVISNMIDIGQWAPSKRTQSGVNTEVLLRKWVHLENKKNHTRKWSNARQHINTAFAR